MLPDVRDDEEIARRRAESAAVPFALHAHARACVHARGDTHLHRLGLRHSALSMTDRTRRPALADTAAIRTFLLEAQAPACPLHLPRTFARRPCYWRAARFACSVA